MGDMCELLTTDLVRQYLTLTLTEFRDDGGGYSAVADAVVPKSGQG